MLFLLYMLFEKMPAEPDYVCVQVLQRMEIFRCLFSLCVAI